MQRLGGFPRLWFSDGGSLDLDRVVPDDQVAEYEAQWRAHGVRVEWLISRRGRLDRVLPQTVERIVRNAQTFAWREHGTGVTLRGSVRKDMLRNTGNKRNVTPR